ncbi:TrgA family protein [Pseudodonghicola flavimaris]|uniref:TrgA family protein n=1 Tax=Pseudodonghicola flavimaris TaxID=3050036 RepID=A0ABT7F1Z6_9RHOB|nr:TrgA family protein [Pseudodonghicola flavimaris]MDK3018530.1 TrgA family protein [Pseudodonghicola flavimaris]
MPTAARLVAALCLGLLAWGCSYLVMARMPEMADFGLFIPVNIGLGLLVGWLYMGRHTGAGPVHILNNGVTSIVLLVFWVLAVQGGYEMFRLAMNRRYHGPLEAIYGIVENALGYAQVLLHPEIPAALLVGGIVSAILTRLAARSWR